MTIRQNNIKGSVKIKDTNSTNRRVEKNEWCYLSASFVKTKYFKTSQAVSFLKTTAATNLNDIDTNKMMLEFYCKFL